MNIDKYPLDNLDADALLNRLTEECSELIHAIAKRKRFGENSVNPKTGKLAASQIVDEMDDVKLIIKEIENRLSSDGSFDPVAGNDAWGGWL